MMKSKRRQWVGSLLLMAVAAAPVADLQAAPPLCAAPADLHALNTRVLQTELMVAALSCSQHNEYNAFVKRFQPELNTEANVLRSLFRRQHGAQGETRMNAFITRLANTASQRSIEVSDTYCNSTSELFQRVLNTSPAGFTALTEDAWIGDRHGYKACSTTTTAAANAPKKQLASRSSTK